MRFGYHKHLTGFTIFLLIAISLSAQTWAPIGAKWTYDRNYHMMVGYPPFRGYTVFTSVKDTVINNVPCKKIERQYFTIGSYNISDTVTGFDPPRYIFEDSGRVYGLLEDSFYIIYDLNQKMGDTLTIVNDIGIGALQSGPDQFTQLVLDTVDTIKLNGVKRIRQGYKWNTINQGSYGLAYNECQSIPNFYHQRFTVIEGIGWVGYFFPHDDLSSPYQEGDLLCYSDTIVGNLKCSERPCDSLYFYFMPGVENLLESNNIYPNPTSGPLLVDLKAFKSQKPESIIVTDINGRNAFETPVNGEETLYLNLNELPSGMYILSVYGEGKIIGERKIIIQ